MIKNLCLSLMIIFGWMSVSTAFATGSLGGNPGCESGAVKVGHELCGAKETKEAKETKKS